MPDFFKIIKKKKRKTIVFPIHENWYEIGNFQDYDPVKKIKRNNLIWKRLKKIIDESKFQFEQIESFYYFPSNRWDIKTKDGFLIKLPEKNIAESLKFVTLIKIKEEFKDKKIIDLRISNQIVLSNEWKKIWYILWI